MKGRVYDPNLGRFLSVDTIAGVSATLRTHDTFGASRNGNVVPRHNGTLNLADTIHGFTGHTHADDVGLIHMRGRVYDPNLGRFRRRQATPRQAHGSNPSANIVSLVSAGTA